mgnify:CR=1 FL=1
MKFKYQVLFNLNDKELEKKIISSYKKSEHPFVWRSDSNLLEKLSSELLDSFDIIFTTFQSENEKKLNQLQKDKPRRILIVHNENGLENKLDKKIIVINKKYIPLESILKEVNRRMYEANELYELLGTSNLIKILSENINDLQDFVERVQNYLKEFFDFSIFEVHTLLKRSGEKPERIYALKRKIDSESSQILELARQDLEEHIDNQSLFLSFYEKKNQMVVTFNLGIYDSKPLYVQLITERINRDLCFQVINELFFKVVKRTLSYLDASEFKNLFQEMAHIDDVTGLFNQRKLYKDLESLMKSADKNSSSFCVLFIDVDHFKKINDKYGHIIGSEVLSQLAVLFKDSIRQTDYFYRYGGDEFVILLAETKAENAQIVAERLLAHIKSKSFEVVEEKPCKLSVSIGIAEYPLDAQTVKDIISIADNMMYNSKRAGRGKVISAQKFLKA